jgi:exodeoxyribonuclease VII large subunit
MEKKLHEKRSAWVHWRMESALAEFPGRLQELAQRLDNGEFALNRLFSQARHDALARWNRCARRFAAFDLGTLLKNRGLGVDNLRERIGARFSQRLRSGRDHVAALSGKLAAMNPETILGKGYSITLDGRQRVVRDAAALAVGDALRIRFARGQVAAKVSEEKK